MKKPILVNSEWAVKILQSLNHPLGGTVLQHLLSAQDVLLQVIATTNGLLEESPLSSVLAKLAAHDLGKRGGYFLKVNNEGNLELIGQDTPKPRRFKTGDAITKPVIVDIPVAEVALSPVEETVVPQTPSVAEVPIPVEEAAIQEAVLSPDDSENFNIDELLGDIAYLNNEYDNENLILEDGNGDPII